MPFLAAELYDAACDHIDYRATMEWKGENIKIGFQPVPPLANLTSTVVRWRQDPFNPPVPRLKAQNLALDQTLVPQVLTLNPRWIELPFYFQLSIGKEANIM